MLKTKKIGRFYYIHRDGTVYSKREGNLHALKPRIHSGYKRVVLYLEEGIPQDFLVHRLIGQAFIDNPNELTEINHINGNRQDNSIENLEWCTHQENMIHAFKTGLIKNKVHQDKPCSVEFCNTKCHSKLLCKMHYQLRRNMNIERLKTY